MGEKLAKNIPVKSTLQEQYYRLGKSQVCFLIANPYSLDVKRDIINQRLNFDWKNVQFSPVLNNI